jgi:hypothetical protein
MGSIAAIFLGVQRKARMEKKIIMALMEKF